MGWLSDEERDALVPAERALPRLPIPVQAVSSDEFVPAPQTERQRRLERHPTELGDALAKRQGVTRRRFFRGASGMAAAFLAMNDVFGPVFDVTRAEAAEPERADARAKALAGQFIMDMHTHFLRDGARALAWTRREIAARGGDPARLFVTGHSAGAYNAAMLALDPRWLGEAGLSPDALAGLVGLAGPYDFLPIENPEVRPVFNHPAYPPDSQPIRHVGRFRRPVFLGAAESDRLVEPRRNTVQLAALLRDAGVPVVERLYPRANHVTLVGAFSGPLRWVAPVLDDVAAFVNGG